MAEKRPEIRIALDDIDEALLRTLAEQNGRTIEEQAAALLERALERMAREFAEEHTPEWERGRRRRAQ